MCATKVQHSPSATISVKPSTHTVSRIRHRARNKERTAGQTQRSIGHEGTYGVLKMPNTVGVIKAEAN